MCKVIFLHLQSLRPLGTAFARLIVCRLRKSLGVNTINILKEESGGSLANDWNLVRVGASVGSCA